MYMRKLQNEKRKDEQGSRIEGDQSGSTKLYPVIALNCCTVDERRNPFFFLFSDIDSKDKYHLSRVLKFFTFNELSFYWYETSKGYHVISPCLLKMEEWYRMRRGLKLVENGYYEGLNIRFSPKNGNDFLPGGFQPIESKLKQSIELLKIMDKRIDKNLITSYYYSYKGTYKHTRLNFSVYKEIEIEGIQY